jgi:hypothetical protein
VTWSPTATAPPPRSTGSPASCSSPPATTSTRSSSTPTTPATSSSTCPPPTSGTPPQSPRSTPSPPSTTARTRPSRSSASTPPALHATSDSLADSQATDFIDASRQIRLMGRPAQGLHRRRIDPTVDPPFVLANWGRSPPWPVDINLNRATFMYRKPQRKSPNLSGTDQERRATAVAVLRVSAGQGHNAALARKISDGGVRIRRRPGVAGSDPVSPTERNKALICKTACQGPVSVVGACVR